MIMEEAILKKYKVIKSRKAASNDPIKLLSGEYVVCVEESDENGDWPNWTRCKSPNCEGWVPSQILKRDKKIGVILEEYDAKEFSIEEGEVYYSSKVVNGWSWAHREEKPDEFAWIPLNHVESIG